MALGLAQVVGRRAGAVVLGCLLLVALGHGGCKGGPDSSDTNDTGDEGDKRDQRDSEDAAYPGRLSPLAEAPSWSELDQFQGIMARSEFIRLLHEVYTQDESYRGFLSIEAEHAVIHGPAGMQEPAYVLRFASGERAASADMAAPAARSGPLALRGLTIAIDPGHIGGPFAELEWRHFRFGQDRYVAEGDLTLAVAELLAERLTRHGSRVVLTRTRPQPITDKTPQELRAVARQSLIDQGALRRGQGALSRADEERLITQEANRLAYRVSDIHARAAMLREIRPDLTICLHFDAVAWERSDRPTPTDKNHMHVLIAGSFTAEELGNDDVRFAMLYRLLGRTHDQELLAARAVARALADATGLPPHIYEPSPSVRRISDDGYIWARNLLANRIYPGPVIYLEPYVMNNPEVYARIQAGDYSGRRLVAGAWRPSIFREYADAVARGVLDYYAGSIPAHGPKQ